MVGVAGESTWQREGFIRMLWSTRMGVRDQGSVVWVQCTNLCRVCVLNLLIAAPTDMGPVRSWSHHGSTVIIIICLITTLVRWWKKLVDIYVIVRGSLWYRGYRVVDICGVMRESRVKVKLLVVINDYYGIVNTKLDWILRWSCDVRDGKWCMWLLRGNPSRVSWCMIVSSCYMLVSSCSYVFAILVLF